MKNPLQNLKKLTKNLNRVKKTEHAMKINRVKIGSAGNAPTVKIVLNAANVKILRENLNALNVANAATVNALNAMNVSTLKLNALNVKDAPNVANVPPAKIVTAAAKTVHAPKIAVVTAEIKMPPISPKVSNRHKLKIKM